VFVLADGQTNLGSKGMGNITLNGNSGANILTGNSGDNQFTGGAGDDTINGGTGNDTASFSGSQGQYRFGVRDAALTISGPDGRDHLVNVEFVKFGAAAAISMASLKSTTADQGLVLVNRNGSDSYEQPDLYTGPVAGLQNQFLGNGQKEIVLGTDKADAINALGGDDAVDGGAGNDVIDGGLGSNFLTGGAGLDQFFLDGRGAATGNTWSTITDWQAGETLTIFGYKPGISALLRLASDGTAGFKGATLHADLDGNGLIDTSITWAGITQAQLPAVQFGADYIFFG
jgi:serralysin